MTTLEMQKPIMQFWLKTGAGATVAQVAELAGYSESAVRKNLADGVRGIEMRMVPHVVTAEDGVESVRELQTFEPTKGLLRELLLTEMGIEVHRGEAA